MLFGQFMSTKSGTPAALVSEMTLIKESVKRKKYLEIGIMVVSLEAQLCNVEHLGRGFRDLL